MLLTEAGDVWVFGRGEGGQLGLEDERVTTLSQRKEGTEVLCALPKRINGFPVGRKVVQIAAGDAHSLALLDDGTVFGWGFSASG